MILPSLSGRETLKTLLTFYLAGRIVLLGEGCSVKGQTVLVLVWIRAVFFFLKAVLEMVTT